MWRIATLGAGLALGAATFGCVPPAPASLAQLQVRSSLDLACPANLLQLFNIGARTKAVTGCGRQLVYVETCHGERECAWVLDSPGAFGAAAVARAEPTSAPPLAPPPLTAAPPAATIWAPSTAAAAASTAPATSHRRVEDFGF
ncbi:MAG: hypothetical protein IT373_02115 [Polyangiaceae bacterium]|nr:hypothetical protein [Polyangiaceae bacterium]